LPTAKGSPERSEGQLMLPYRIHRERPAISPLAMAKGTPSVSEGPLMLPFECIPRPILAVGLTQIRPQCTMSHLATIPFTIGE